MAAASTRGRSPKQQRAVGRAAGAKTTATCGDTREPRALHRARTDCACYRIAGSPGAARRTAPGRAAAPAARCAAWPQAAVGSAQRLPTPRARLRRPRARPPVAMVPHARASTHQRKLQRRYGVHATPLTHQIVRVPVPVRQLPVPWQAGLARRARPVHAARRAGAWRACACAGSRQTGPGPAPYVLRTSQRSQYRCRTASWYDQRSRGGSRVVRTALRRACPPPPAWRPRR